MSRKHLVEVARGGRQSDLVIKNVNVVNTLTQTLDGPVDIGIYQNRIAFVLPAGKAKEGKRTINGKGMFAAPGFVDGHVHNESSMCTPAQWAKTIVPMGTTTVFTDPHEIGNVMGLSGIEYMLKASEGIPLRYFVTAPSCVPAVPSVETAGAEITAQEMDQLLSWDRVVAVAEAMDYEGLISQGGNITPIVEVGHKYQVPIEGHAPGVVGNRLQAYLSATGPRASDHESWEADEMLEKAKSGMMVYARDSTFLDTMSEIAEAIKRVKDHRYFGFCTDDIFAHLLLDHGHLNKGVRNLIKKGVDPLIVYQMASINVASHYGLHGVGAIAPGWFADILLLDDLENVGVRHVIFDGKLVVKDAEWQITIRESVEPLTRNSVILPTNLSQEDFNLHVTSKNGTNLNAIEMSELITKPIQLEVEVNQGIVELGNGQSIAAIVPRHGQNQPPSLALIHGYPLKKGAIASTVSHDSHNLTVIGKSAEDMLIAVRHLEKTGGGLVAILDGNVVSDVAFPIAGLMSPKPVSEIADKVRTFETTMPSLGLPQAFPIHLIALALPVFPVVRLTDKGMVNVATQEIIPLLA